MLRLARLTAVVALTLVFLAVLWQFRLILLLFLFSLFIAAAIRPLLVRLVQRGVPSILAQLFTYLSIVLLFGVSIYFLATPLATEIEAMISDLRRFYENAYDDWRDVSEEGAAPTVEGLLIPPSQLFDSFRGDENELWVTLTSVTQNVMLLAAGSILVIFLGIYWSQDQVRFERLWLSLLPYSTRVEARNAWRNIEYEIGAYVRGRFMQSLLIMPILGLVYYLVGMPYVILMVVLAALTKLIPFIGNWLIIALTYLIGLTQNTTTAFVAAALTTAVLAAIRYWIAPRFFDREEYSALLIILITIPFVQIFGVIGFLFAPPVAIMIESILKQIFAYVTAQHTASDEVQIERLHARLAELEKRFENAEPNRVYPPEIENIIKRLGQLIEETEALPQAATEANAG